MPIPFSARYINWRSESTFIQCTFEEYNEKVRWFLNNGTPARSKTVWHDWTENGTYNIDGQNQKYESLYCRENDKFFIYAVNKMKEGIPGAKGKNAFHDINYRLSTLYHTTMTKAFGLVNVDFKICTTAIPPVIWVDERILSRRKKHAYKSDFSSAWPFGLCGALPDAHTAKVMQGHHDPTEEYPFAFYNTGHSAIFGELSTEEIARHPIYKNRGKFLQLNESEEVTVLMKASGYQLDAIIEGLYYEKEHATSDELREQSKSTLNSFIGYLHSVKTNRNHFAAHIAAVVYARSLKWILAKYDSIIKQNRVPIAIATDAVIWLGGEIEDDVKKEDKYLGAFVREFSDCDIYFCANNVYAVEKDGEIIILKHQGSSLSEEDLNNIQKIEDIEYIRRSVVLQNEVTHEFVVMEEI